jgi:hypothetical protein
MALPGCGTSPAQVLPAHRDPSQGRSAEGLEDPRGAFPLPHGETLLASITQRAVACKAANRDAISIVPSLAHPESIRSTVIVM